MLNKLSKILILTFCLLLLSSCLAKSSYVVKLAKGVEANSKNHKDLVDALNKNGTLPKEQATPLSQNAQATFNYNSDLSKESPSIFSFESLVSGLNTLASIADVAGSYFGLPAGTIEKGIALATLIGGFFEHRRRIRKEKIKTKVVAKLPAQNAKDYQEAEKEVQEEIKAGKVKI